MIWLPKDELDNRSSSDCELGDNFSDWDKAIDAGYDWLQERGEDYITWVEYGFFDDNVWIETDSGLKCCGGATIFVTVQGRKGVINYSFGH